MQTLHEMLKREAEPPIADQTSRKICAADTDKIGISAVAAATQFNRVEDYTDAAAPRRIAQVRAAGPVIARAVHPQH